MEQRDQLAATPQADSDGQAKSSCIYSVHNHTGSPDMEVGSTGPGAAVMDISEEKCVQEDESGLKRRLQGRHLRFLALGGGIGTGLFVGTGNVLSTGGPGSMIINFVLLAFMIICVIFAIGELVTLFPVAGAYSVMVSRFVDPSLGFAIGLNFLLTWLIILPVELTAVSIVISFWDSHEKVPKGVWIAIVLVVIFGVNLVGVRAFSEVEFFATTIKTLTLIGFIICGVVIVCGGTPSGKYLGAHYWHDPGAFTNGFKGFCSVFVLGAFSYGGSELVGMAAAEASQPRKHLPHAFKMIVWRVCIFYILSLFIVTLIVPYNDERLMGGSSNPRASPFVIAIQNGKINALPHIVNAAILISVISMANSAVYASSRMFMGMSEKRLLPKIFAYTDRQGRPLVSFVVVFAFGLLAFLVYSASEGEIFSWLAGISGLATIFMWGAVCLAHLRFRYAWKKQGNSLRQLPWKSPLGIWGSMFGLFLNILLIAGNFYYSAFPINEGNSTPQQRAHDFFENMISAIIVFFSFVIHKLATRSRFVRIDSMDLESDRREPVSQDVLDRERAEAASKPLWHRILHVLF